MVLANICDSEVHCPYRMIQRVWMRDSFRHLISILLTVIRLRAYIVHFQYEYMLYGKPIKSGIFPLVLALLRLIGKRVIVTMHSVIIRSSLSSNFFERYGAGKHFATIKKILTIGVSKFVGLFSHKIIVHTEAARRELIQSYKFNKQKICVIRHGMELINANLNPDITVHNNIVYFGFLRPEKGIEYAIKALPRVLDEIPEAKLTIIGEPHMYLTRDKVSFVAEIKRLIRELNISDKVVLVERFIPDEELCLCLPRADVFVLPYIDDDVIGASGVVSKLACYGKPIVATNIPRFKDLIDGVCGLIVPKRDERALADALIKLLQNASLKLSLGSKLREYARDNCWEEIARRTLALYREEYNHS